jgi:hypothetical protein
LKEGGEDEEEEEEEEEEEKCNWHTPDWKIKKKNNG